jgi:glycosyltransferase involved in cell wall biosynthesis
VRFFLLGQLVRLRQQGHDVHVYCSAGPWRDEIERAGVPVTHVPLARAVRPLADLRALLALTAHFRRERFDLVHTHTPKANLLGRLAARAAGVPLVVGTEHGLFYYNMRGAQRAFYRWLARLGAWCSDVVFFVSAEDVRVATTTDRVCPPSKAIHLAAGVGVDIERFRPSAELRRQTRTALSYGDDDLVVGMVGRLTYEKGYAEFFQAASLLSPTLPQARFLVIGPSDAVSQEEFERLVATLGLSSRVRFLGMRTDMPELYNAMDVVALPSHREGLPVTLMEAAACGLPAVATDIRGCREVIVAGQTGLLVPPRDAAALAAALERVLSDPVLRARLGQAARQRAEAVYDQRLAWTQVENAYRRLAAASRRFQARYEKDMGTLQRAE